MVKRLSALEKFTSVERSLGATASEITAAGTCIDVSVTFILPSVKVSPELASTP